MLLKELASCPSSSLEMMGTSWSRLPAPMAAADSVTARMGTRMVRIVPARRRTARAMPKARPQPYQTSAAAARRRAALSAVFHVVLVDLPDAARHLLDLQEGVVQARLAALAEIERTASGLAVGEELVARPAIGDARCGQRIDQFLLAGQGDVVCSLRKFSSKDFHSSWYCWKDFCSRPARANWKEESMRSRASLRSRM